MNEFELNNNRAKEAILNDIASVARQRMMFELEQISEDELSSDSVVEKLFAMMAYEIEWYKHGNDHDQRIGAEPNDYQLDLLEQHTRRLISGMQGDYLGIQEYCQYLINDIQECTYNESGDDKAALEQEVQKFRLIYTFIPKNGTPLKLPQPAWTDPRFNSELERGGDTN